MSISTHSTPPTISKTKNWEKIKNQKTTQTSPGKSHVPFLPYGISDVSRGAPESEPAASHARQHCCLLAVAILAFRSCAARATTLAPPASLVKTFVHVPLRRQKASSLYAAYRDNDSM